VGQGTASVWTSADGSGWARADLDAGGAHAAEASAGARRHGRAVVVGTVTAPAGDRDGRIWTSTDGVAWQPVQEDPSVLGGPGDQEITSVEAGALGFVAAGLDRRGQQALPAVWTSADGLSWSRVSAGPASPFLDGQVVLGVAVGAADAVAVGTLRTGAETDAMAWFSPDGITWRTVPLGLAGFTGPADQVARSVTATSDGFVAVGDDARGDRRVAVVWTSTDGITWQRQPPSPDMAELPGGDSTQGVSAADVAGTGPVVAVGGGFAMQVWTSPDGRRWTREQPPVQDVGSDPTGVATDGRSLLVVVGHSSLWSRPPGGVGPRLRRSRRLPSPVPHDLDRQGRRGRRPDRGLRVRWGRLRPRRCRGVDLHRSGSLLGPPGHAGRLR
jgi:hypothetical protein